MPSSCRICQSTPNRPTREHTNSSSLSKRRTHRPTELQSLSSQVTDVFQFLQKITFVNDQSDAGDERADAINQIHSHAFRREVILQRPYPETERQGARRGNENNMERFEGHIRFLSESQSVSENHENAKSSG